MWNTSIALLVVYVISGMLIGWLASRWRDGSRKTTRPDPIDDAGSLLKELSDDSQQHAAYLRVFARWLRTGDDAHQDAPRLREVYESNRLYEERLKSRSDHLAATASRMEVALWSVLKQLVEHAGSVQELSGVLAEYLEEEPSGEARTLMSAAVTAVLESNRQLDSKLATARREIAEQKARYHKPLREARIDTLTKLPNRRAFDEHLETVHSRFERGHEAYAVVLFDIDQFTELNERYGYRAGDAALAVFARILSGGVRSYDHPARVGGEEFAVLLPGSSSGEATLVAERCRKRAMQAWVRVGDDSFQFTVSAGIAVAEDGRQPAEVFSAAEQALRTAKDAGRNRVECEPHADEPAETELEPVGV